MSLTRSLNIVRNTIKQSIDTLIQQGLGMQHPNSSAQVLDLRAFKITGDLTNPYNLEILFPDHYAVQFIGRDGAYDENNNIRSLDSVFDASLGSLCEALDVLATYGLPRYQIVLRATVLAEVSDIGNDMMIFSPSWGCYDHDLDDGVHAFRLDTTLTVTAPSIEAAIERAKNDAPDLGLDNPEVFQVNYWVDTSQACDVVMLPLVMQAEIKGSD